MRWSRGSKRSSPRKHELDNTYIVFSSDNGYHMGQHELSVGKMTAFDTDVRVPLIVAGPGVPHGRTVHAVTQNVDLAPTFEELAGARVDPSVDGRSLVPLLHGESPPWRVAALVEHRGRTLGPGDPDYIDAKGDGDPTTYKAVRVSAPRLPHFRGRVEAVWVRYRDGEREFYDLARDPYERVNRAGALNAAQRGRARRDALPPGRVPRCRRAGSRRLPVLLRGDPT